MEGSDAGASSSVPREDKRPGRGGRGAVRSAIRAASVYAVFGVLWVLVTDRVVHTFVEDADTRTAVQTAKGWAFVVVSALILYVFVRTEVRARRRAERAELENAEMHRRLENVLESVADGFVGLGSDWRYTYVNRTGAELLGRTPDELIGKHIWTEFPERKDLPFARAFERVMATRQAGTHEDHLDPGDRWFENRIYPTPDGGIAIYFRDVSERRQMEQALRESEEHLSRHAVELERLVEERTESLRERNEELDAFARTVSHDLRAPLRAMEGLSRALLEDFGDALDDLGREYTSRIVNAAETMDALITDLLAYSRLSRGDVPLQALPLDGVLAAALEHVADEVKRAGAMIEVERPLPAVIGHLTTLVQVVANLVSNGVKFVAPGVSPVIRIAATTEGDVVRLTVTDNGIGIASEHQDRIFRVLERLHGVEAYAGTGIGLAIVRKGVDRMGGRCGVESEPGAASTFWVELQGTSKPASVGVLDADPDSMEDGDA